MSDESPIRIAIVGSGPAGFYAAGHLLKDSSERVHVDMIERLPTPWGLVRSGVAPDHPKIKSVSRIYEKTAASPRFRYFGNVTFGEHVSREDLLAHYHAIVYATGSPSDRPLGIPGEELPGSHAATEFVGWYNGHPDQTQLEFDLVSAERAVVIGNGNVALDVARMLVLAPAELAPTDTADHALEVLAASRVAEVVILGRRGPAQAAFTNPELLELGELAGADVIVDPAELDRALAVEDAAAEQDITRRRNVEILRSYAERAPVGHPKRIVLRFLLSPLAFLPDERGRLGSVELVRNELVPAPAGGLRRPGHRGARDDPRRAGLPRDRLPRHVAAGRALRRASRRHPQPRRARPRSRQRAAAARRVRRRLDQARPHRRDRHQQEGRPGDRRRAARRPLGGRATVTAPPTLPTSRTPPPWRSFCARASPSSSPTPVGRRSTATSARSESAPDVRV